jgi:hypothetical protein
MLFLILSFLASADLNPPNTTIENAVFVDIPPDGFGAIIDLLPGLLPEGIPIDDQGAPITNCEGYFIENITLDFEITDSQITPQEGYLELNIGLNLLVNDATNPFETHFATDLLFCLETDCIGWVDPIPLEVITTIALEVDSNGQVDAIITDPQLDFTFNSNVQLGGPPSSPLSCPAGGINQILAALGIDILQLLEPLIEGAVEGIIPLLKSELETMIEESFSELNIQESFEIEGSTIELELQPTAIDINSDGLRLIFDGGTSSEDVSQCIVAYDEGGSLASEAELVEIGYAPSSITTFQLAANVSDDFANQALYTFWRAGVLCYSIDEELFPLDTSILNLLTGDAFNELIPETQEMVIQTKPENPPLLNVSTDADLAVDIENLGLDFFTIIDNRRVRVLNVALTTDVGINLLYDINTGNLAADIDLDTDRVVSSVFYNEFLPSKTSEIEADFSGQLDTILEMVGIESLLGDLSFNLPSLEGSGLVSMQTAATGLHSEDLGIYAEIGEVPYTTGCDDTSQGCEGGCANNGQPNNRLALGLFALLFGLLRRRN